MTEPKELTDENAKKRMLAGECFFVNAEEKKIEFPNGDYTRNAQLLLDIPEDSIKTTDTPYGL